MLALTASLSPWSLSLSGCLGKDDLHHMKEYVSGCYAECGTPPLEQDSPPPEAAPDYAEKAMGKVPSRHPAEPADIQ